MLTWGLYDLAGGFYGPITQRHAGSSVTVELNGPRRAMLRMSAHDPLAEHIAPAATVLRAWLDGAPVFAGPAGTPTWRGREAVIEIPALGPYNRLARAYVGQRSDGAVLAGAPSYDYPYSQFQQPEGYIMQRLVAHASPSVAELTAGVPDHGILSGSISPGMNRDRTYEPGKRIWDAIVELSAVRQGQDFDLAPIHDDENPAALAQLDVVPRLGRDLTDTVLLEFGVGQSNASQLVWSPSADITNRMTGVGEAPTYEGSGPAPVPPRFTSTQLDSLIAHGIYAAYEGLTGVSEITTVAETVSEVVSTGAWPVNFFEVTPALQDGSGYVSVDGRVHRVPGFGIPPRFGPIGEWWLGDSISCRGWIGSRLIDVAGRVIGATIDEVDQAGNAQVSVTCAPEIHATVTS